MEKQDPFIGNPPWIELRWKDKPERGDNPKTENIDGKTSYPLNFQKVELLSPKNKTASKTEQMQLQFASNPSNNYPSWKNLLFYGDNLSLIDHLLKGFEIEDQFYHLKNQIKLIYIDPPFATGLNFHYKIKSISKGNHGQEIDADTASPILEHLAYRDSWEGKSDDERLSTFLSFIYHRLLLMKQLLSDDGTIYIHLDYRTVHYVKIMMDEIFGRNNFRNEIIWCYTGPSRSSQDFPDKHDTILRYTKSDQYTFNSHDIKIPYVKRDTGKTQGIFKKRALLDESGKIPEDWWSDLTPVARLHKTELLNYPTQKPESLMARIILASSNPGDIVADFFCGSGSFAAAAEKLNRRWITSDISTYSILLSQNRLLSLSQSKALKSNTSASTYDKPTNPFYCVWTKSPLQKILITDTDYIQFSIQLYGAKAFTQEDPYLHARIDPKTILSVMAIHHPLTIEELEKLIAHLKTTQTLTKDNTIVVLLWKGIEHNLLPYFKSHGFHNSIRMIQMPTLSKIEEIISSYASNLLVADLIETGKPLPQEMIKQMRYPLPTTIELFLNEQRIEIGTPKLRLNNPISLKIKEFWIDLNGGNKKAIRDGRLDEIPSTSQPLINFWMIDWNYNSVVHRYTTIKTDNQRDNTDFLIAQHQYDHPGQYTIAVVIVDTIGNAYPFSLNIEI